MNATAALRTLERGGADVDAADLVRRLAAARLPNARQVLALHEELLRRRAQPADADSLEAVEAALAGFGERRDVRALRRELRDSGVAGTDLVFPYYWLTACWLLARWPDALRVEWSEFERAKQLRDVLYVLQPVAEAAALDDEGTKVRRLVEVLRGPDETDAVYLLRRFTALEVTHAARERLYEQLDMPVRLVAGAGTPARTHERWDGARVVLDRPPWPAGRPDLRRAARSLKFRVRTVEREEGQRLIDLANSCMVTRQRDLYAFLNAAPDDVRVVDFGDGLQFACLGVVPAGRIVLEAVYGFLTLLNGVPIGYVLCSALYESSEVAYNVFEAFRGAGAAQVYARVLAMLHGLFGSTSFAVDPYQLGHRNAEGQASGAWWFYYKLGFRPDDPGVRALVDEELARLEADPGQRTSRARLNQLAAKPMLLHLGRPRADVLGRLDLGCIGRHVSRHLARIGGADREGAARACERTARRALGLSSVRGWSSGERLALESWAPLLSLLAEEAQLAAWTAGERRALIAVVRAKGGRREADFVPRFDRHARLRAALLALAGREPDAAQPRAAGAG